MHLFLRLSYSIAIIAAVLVYLQLRDTSTGYDHVLSATASQSIIAQKVTVSDTELKIPSYDLFTNDAIWALVSKQRPISGVSQPSLVPIPIPHGDGDSAMSVSSQIADPLRAIYAAAQADGLELMVSSGYRSREEQQALFDKYSTTRGQEFTITHVSPAGASEHQTGLAVDFSSASKQCLADSDKCELNYLAIGWLAENAPRYGFIQRYPLGKQSITGIANEEWHYRYVGKPLAVALTGAGMTLDEFVAQVAPGYTK